MRLKGQFDKVTFIESPGKLQKASGNGDDLEPGFGAIAVAGFDQGWRGCKLNASRTMAGVALGIVGHAEDHYGIDRGAQRDYRSPMYEFTVRVGLRVLPVFLPLSPEVAGKLRVEH